VPAANVDSASLGPQSAENVNRASPSLTSIALAGTKCGTAAKRSARPPMAGWSAVAYSLSANATSMCSAFMPPPAHSARSAARAPVGTSRRGRGGCSRGA
jgi:hypothetical protein